MRGWGKKTMVRGPLYKSHRAEHRKCQDPNLDPKQDPPIWAPWFGTLAVLACCELLTDTEGCPEITRTATPLFSERRLRGTEKGLTRSDKKSDSEASRSGLA